MDVDVSQTKSRILLAVTGLAPQVVTETLYALAVARTPPWIPAEIHLITTQKGADKARQGLLAEDGGWFHRLCREYGLPGIAFETSHIHVIAGPDGQPIQDILIADHNALIADFITEHVRRLTADPGTSLHVSIAGGRKTVGFYAGHALSLFGRAQDRLSHVLVSEPFEGLDDFYYPSPSSRMIKGRGDCLVDAHQAQVHLGEIPFVRLRHHLPPRLLEGQAIFSQVIADAQKALEPAWLKLEPGTREVMIAGQRLSLDPILFAFYWMLAERRRGRRGGVRRDEKGLANELLRYYGLLVDTASAQYERTRLAYRTFDASNFDFTKTRLNKALVTMLGKQLAAPYRVDKEGVIPGTRIHTFGLSLPPECIQVDLASLQDRRSGAG